MFYSKVQTKEKSFHIIFAASKTLTPNPKQNLHKKTTDYSHLYQWFYICILHFFVSEHEDVFQKIKQVFYSSNVKHTDNHFPNRTQTPQYGIQRTAGPGF